MEINDLITLAINPALDILPDKMSGDSAVAMLVAIAMQESRIKHRKQLQGPAVGFWQFERGGIRGVLTHAHTKKLAQNICHKLNYSSDVETVYEALPHNDILAAVFARLLLYTVPSSLPSRRDADEAWRQYLWAWRPGKPHVRTWAEHYTIGWEHVN